MSLSIDGDVLLEECPDEMRDWLAAWLNEWRPISLGDIDTAGLIDLKPGDKFWLCSDISTADQAIAVTCSAIGEMSLTPVISFAEHLTFVSMRPSRNGEYDLAGIRDIPQLYFASGPMIGRPAENRRSFWRVFVGDRPRSQRTHS